MRYLVFLFLTVFLFSSVLAQSEQAVKNLEAVKERRKVIKELEVLKERHKVLDAAVLQPDKADIDEAVKENVNVFRLLPREKYDAILLETRGGGAYYSFVKKSNNYNDIPQIALNRDELATGFYGASYGFIADLGEISLAEISRETKGVDFLTTYQPPNEISKARIEQKKGNYGFEEDGIFYKNRVPSIVGHTYTLRAVSYNEADVLVAFRIYRKDADGSLIVFWKLIEQFEKPFLGSSTEVSVNQEASDAALQEKILKSLQAKGFYNVTVDTSTKPLTLRGRVPKGKLSEAIQTAQETLGKPFRNQITEQ